MQQEDATGECSNEEICRCMEGTRRHVNALWAATQIFEQITSARRLE